MTPDQQRALDLLRSELFTTKAVCKGTGLCERTVWSIRHGSNPWRKKSLVRIADWMRSVKDQLP